MDSSNDTKQSRAGEERGTRGSGGGGEEEQPVEVKEETKRMQLRERRQDEPGRARECHHWGPSARSSSEPGSRRPHARVAHRIPDTEQSLSPKPKEVKE